VTNISSKDQLFAKVFEWDNWVAKSEFILLGAKTKKKPEQNCFPIPKSQADSVRAILRWKLLARYARQRQIRVPNANLSLLISAVLDIV